MSITASCPRCQQSYRLKDAFAGKKVKCTTCGTMFSAPAAAPAPQYDELESAAPAAPPPAPPSYAYVPPIQLASAPLPSAAPGPRVQPMSPPQVQLKQASNQSLVVVSVAVSGLVMVGAIVLAIVLVFSNKDQPKTVATPSNQPGSEFITSPPGPQFGSPQPQNGGGPSQPPALPNIVTQPSGQASGKTSAYTSEPVPEKVELDAEQFNWNANPPETLRLNNTYSTPSFRLRLPGNMQEMPKPAIERGEYFHEADYFHLGLTPTGFMKVLVKSLKYRFDTSSLTFEAELSRAETELRKGLSIKEFRKGKLTKGEYNRVGFAQFRWSGVIDGERVCGYLAMGMTGDTALVCAGACTGPPTSALYKQLEAVLFTINR